MNFLDSKKENPSLINSRALYISAALLVGIMVGVVISHYTGRMGQPGDTLAQIRQRGIVRLGFANEAPFAFLDKNGRLTGEAPEVARIIFSRMGVERVEGVLTEFGSLIPELNADHFDVIAAGMYITPERRGQISFSYPTYKTSPGLLVLAGNPKKLHSYEDVRDNRNAVVGVILGAVEQYDAAAAGIPEERIFAVPDIDTGISALRSGRADALAMTKITVSYLANRVNMSGLEIAEPFIGSKIKTDAEKTSYGAFGFRLKDARMQSEFNRHLDDFLGTPEHLALVARFGIDAEAVPGRRQAATVGAIAEKRDRP